MKIGGHDFEIGKQVYIMGILNVTPDSFSDGGQFAGEEQAVRQAEQMIEDGAHLIDVGGESTRPGYTRISVEEEIQRILPVIRIIKQKFDIPVSVDTYKSGVARAALDAGADLINDIWGFRYDGFRHDGPRHEKNMAAVAAEYSVPVCLMHNRDNTDYENFVPEVIADLKESLAAAERYGVAPDKIILDPGVGFGKTYEQNLSIIHHLDEICRLGYPVLLGASRKSVIGRTLNLPVTEREEGTIATSVIAAMKGCTFVRVHDVRANARALRMTEAVQRADTLENS